MYLFFFRNPLYSSKYHAWSHHPKNIQLNLLRVNKLNVSKSIIISSLSIMSMSCYIVIMLRCQNITPFIHPHYIFYTFNSLYFHFNFFFLSILFSLHSISIPFNLRDELNWIKKSLLFWFVIVINVSSIRLSICESINKISNMSTEKIVYP